MTLPVPEPNADSHPYWDAAREDRLILQKCTACGTMQAVPRRYCGTCRSDDLGWIQSKRHGTIASLSRVMRGPTAAFHDHVPYVLCLVDLDEGVRLMLNLRGQDLDAADIGDAVEIMFEARGEDGFKIPQARRIGPA